MIRQFDSTHHWHKAPLYVALHDLLGLQLSDSGPFILICFTMFEQNVSTCQKDNGEKCIAGASPAARASPLCQKPQTGLPYIFDKTQKWQAYSNIKHMTKFSFSDTIFYCHPDRSCPK